MRKDRDHKDEDHVHCKMCGCEIASWLDICGECACEEDGIID